MAIYIAWFIIICSYYFIDFFPTLLCFPKRNSLRTMNFLSAICFAITHFSFVYFLKFCWLYFFLYRNFLKRSYLLTFRERGKEGKRGRETSVCERNTDRLSPCILPTWHLACNPGMCPDWGLNQWPFSPWVDVQPTKPPQSRPCIEVFIFI